MVYLERGLWSPLEVADTLAALSISMDECALAKHLVQMRGKRISVLCVLLCAIVPVYKILRFFASSSSHKVIDTFISIFAHFISIQLNSIQLEFHLRICVFLFNWFCVRIPFHRAQTQQKKRPEKSDSSTTTTKLIYGNDGGFCVRETRKSAAFYCDSLVMASS